MKELRNTHREQLFIAQGGRCFYCGRPMWIAREKGGQHGYGAFQRRHQLPKAIAKSLQCTLEHLRPIGDPLRHKIEAKAAACQHCNSRRGEIPPDIFAQQQQEKFRMTSHKIHNHRANGDPARPGEPTPRSGLRKIIGQAIFDPGAVVGYKGERSLTDWQLDAVMAVLADEAPTVALPDGSTIPDGEYFILQGTAFPVGKGQGDNEQIQPPIRCKHQRVTTWRDASQPGPYLQCDTCGRKFSDETELDFARREAGEGERGADPQPEASTGARATGWQILPNHSREGDQRDNLAGYHYAEGPGDLRIRTNDRPLLDKILWLLQLQIDPDQWPAMEAAAAAYRNGYDAGKLAGDPDQVARQAVDKAMDPPFSMERVAAKAGVDLGGNPLPSPGDIDQVMMTASEEYVAGRSHAVVVTSGVEAPRFYYDAAHMRAAFRAGYDYARSK